jgi:hypothetical protein
MTNIVFVIYVKCCESLNVISKWVAMVKTKFGSMLIRIQDFVKLNIVGL